MGLDGVTGSDENVDDASGPGGAHLMFDLHGFENDEHLAGSNPVARGDLDGDDPPGHRSGGPTRQGRGVPLGESGELDQVGLAEGGVHVPGVLDVVDPEAPGGTVELEQHVVLGAIGTVIDTSQLTILGIRCW